MKKIRKSIYWGGELLDSNFNELKLDEELPRSREKNERKPSSLNNMGKSSKNSAPKKNIRKKNV